MLTPDGASDWATCAFALLGFRDVAGSYGDGHLVCRCRGAGVFISAVFDRTAAAKKILKFAGLARLYEALRGSKGRK